MMNFSCLFFNVLVSVLLSLYYNVDVDAFYISSPLATSATREGQRLFLFVDHGLGEYSQEVIDSSKSNEWGIPSSKTLPPLANSPKDQLENGGRITLVGSGPGDPELLTMKAVKLLQDPNSLVIVDRLVSPEIVELIQGEIKVARKLPGCAELAQEEIYWWAHQGLAAGKHVIRLKIGDPFVFGRGGEEVLKFRQYGVESKVVPVRLENAAMETIDSGSCSIHSLTIFL
jgi:Tetrapyrrole (Corrin/Porphyrin) Methylases